jgi:predicted AlkP superfamily pyrophosphatase or phosphodiesterase
MSSRIVRRGARLICLLAFSSACFADRPAELAEVQGKKVLVIGIDGIRPDVLARLETPNIDALIAEGAYSGSVQSQAQTVSGPAWSSILTGVWPAKHRVVSNDLSTNEYDWYPDFLTRLEQVDPDFSTFAVIDWPPLGVRVSGGPMISDSIDVKLNFDGDQQGYALADSQSVDAAVRYILNQDPDAMFVYIGYPDVAAHDHGGLSEEYLAAIRMADAHVGTLSQAVARRTRVRRTEDWLVLVVTDHGHRDAGGHGGTSPEEKTVFYLASGASASKGRLEAHANIVDIAVTAMAHLGVPADASWRLDGRVTGLRSGGDKQE